MKRKVNLCETANMEFLLRYSSLRTHTSTVPGTRCLLCPAGVDLAASSGVASGASLAGRLTSAGVTRSDTISCFKWLQWLQCRSTLQAKSILWFLIATVTRLAHGPWQKIYRRIVIYSKCGKNLTTASLPNGSLVVRMENVGSCDGACLRPLLVYSDLADFTMFCKATHPDDVVCKL